MTSAEVVVVGGGPSGLAAAEAIARRGVRDVLVLDRDEEPGGVPRHSDHPGYGMRDLRRSLTGPAYARRRAAAAQAAGATLLPRATATGWTPDLVVDVTSPRGRERIEAGAIVLATGCRERPRPARLVPGDRPGGVYTTGWLQRLVHLEHGRPGSRAVVVGAEHVSYSALLTLAETGCETVAMITDADHHTTYTAFHLGARTRWAVPLLTRTRIVAIHGHGRVESVEVRHEPDGRRALIPCDTVVFTGDWVSENELARRAGLAIAAGTGGPAVDPALRTSQPGVFAVGNVLHPAATADVCALDGAHVAAAVEARLRDPAAPWPGPGVRVDVDPPLLWCSPTRVAPGQVPPRGRLLLQTDRRRRLARVDVRQGGATLWSGRVPAAVPTRPFPIPAHWTARVDPDGGPVRVSLG